MGDPHRVDILEHTLSLTPMDFAASTIVDYTTFQPKHSGNPPIIEVTGEKSQDAIFRFSGHRVAVLNFASGVSPGGGTRYGARAQEEDLCLCSNLLLELESLPGFYEKNQEDKAPPECYDRMIVSHGVTFFKDGNYMVSPSPMMADVITYPAPNMGRMSDPGRGASFVIDGIRFRGRSQGGELVQVATPVEQAAAIFNRRIPHILDQAHRIQAEVLILGAWGCGAYGNDPTMVANAFQKAIAVSPFSGKIVFAIYGNVGNQKAFHKAFGR